MPLGGYRAPLSEGEITEQLFRRAVLPGTSLGRAIAVTGWAARWGWSLPAESIGLPCLVSL